MNIDINYLEQLPLRLKKQDNRTKRQLDTFTKRYVNTFESVFKGLVEKYGLFSIVCDKFLNHSLIKHNKSYINSFNLCLNSPYGKVLIFKNKIDWTCNNFNNTYYLEGDVIKPIQEHPEYLSKVKYKYWRKDKQHLHVVDQFNMYSCICFYLDKLYLVEFNKDYIDYLYNKGNITLNLIEIGFSVDLAVKHMSKLKCY